MRDGDKTKEQLINELVELRERITELGASESQCQEAEEQIRHPANLIENISDAIISTDVNFNIKSWNKAAETIYGWQAEEVIGKPIADVTKLEYPYNRTEEVVEQFFEKGYWQGEVVQKRKDGTTLNIITSVSLFKDSAGNPVGAVAINRDITKRKRAEVELQEAFQLNTLLLDSIPHPAMLIRPDRTVIAANNIALKMGAKIGEPCWREWAKSRYIRGDEKKCYFCMADEAMDEQKAWNCEVESFERLWDTWWVPVGEDVYLHYAIDITERQRSEEELRKHRDHLEELVEERTVELRAANEQLRGEITERKEVEARERMVLRVLEVLNTAHERKELLSDIVQAIKEFSKCSALAIRLRQGGDFPYQEASGFPREFVELESSLCAADQQGEPYRDSEGNPILECMCGMVVSGKADPTRPFFTQGGSFWTNSTTDLLSFISEEDKRAMRIRGQCHLTGYESVALIPLKSGDEVIGLLQLDDEQRNRFTSQLIKLYEGLGESIGVTLKYRQTQEALRESEASLSEAQRIAHLGNWDWDIVRDELCWSDEIYRIFGLTPQEFGTASKAFLNSVHPSDRDPVKKAVNRALSEDTSYSIDHRILLPDGSERTVHEQAQVVLDDTGRAIRMVGTVQDITERKRVEEEQARRQQRLEALWGMARMVDADYQTLGDHVLAGIVALTQSRYGFYGFLNEDESEVTLYAWSSEVMKDCRVQDEPLVFSIAKAGLWADAVRDRRTLIINDYQADHPSKKGLPGGHVHLTRLLAVPILSSGHIVALAAVANKAGEYTAEDAEQINAFVTSALAILDRRQAEERARRLAGRVEQQAKTMDEILSASPDQFYMYGRTGKYIYANLSAARALGLEQSDIVGRSWRELGFPPEIMEPVDEHREEVFATGESFWGETHFPVREGIRQYEYILSPIHSADEGIEAVVTTVRDITERKRMETALVAERASLARRVEERTAELSMANAELARASRLKDEFLASMSHELRTPLNAVLGLSEALQELVYGPLTERQLRSLRTIEESGRHLLALINDILDVSKVEAGKMELEIDSVSVESVCQASLGLIKQTAGEKRLRVSSTFDGAVTVMQADERHLKQILVNLLSNAVKFTPEGGEFGLEVEGDVEQELIHFTVWDTGIGIPPDQIERLFQPFVQLDSSLSRQYAGTGLGLALVHRLAKLHGGGVSVESEVGKGSRFTVSLPWRAPAEEAGLVEGWQPAESDMPGVPAIHRALMVEDSPSAADQVARYLAELGAETVVHPRGEGAVEKALVIQPDVIILDIQLPDLSGWGVLERLKADPRTRDIPVLIISVVDEWPRGLRSGVAEHLVKPVSRQQLRRALNKILPQATKEAPALVSVIDQGRKASQPLILLAEDNEGSIVMVSDYLLVRGYRVIVARNGAEAVERANAERPDLILMDIQMPGVHGLEAIRRIRVQAEQSEATVPIIALTALAMPGDRERCLAAGANEYLSKPVSLRKLLQAIQAQWQKT